MKTDKIYLVGFMGSGKSTLAHALGRRLRWRVEDIDALIEAREGRTIAAIFQHAGEPTFRKAEREVLRSLLTVRHTVVATGGGTFVEAENRTLINTDGMSIWLDLPIETVIERVPSDGRRPLAADRERLEHLYAVRQAAYRQAHLRLDASRTQTGELVERVLEWIGD